MVAKRLYDGIYAFGAPWDMGPRDELVQLVESGRLSASELPRAIDLGCGTGANAIFLAEHGFDTTGVDFSPVALKKARAKVAGATPAPRFVRGDLTAEAIPDVAGPFDLLVDYGTLDDMGQDGRKAMARTIVRLSAGGSMVLFWCFYGERDVLPRMSFTGPSKMSAGLAFDEENTLFGEDFDIETIHAPERGTHGFACFLLQRH